MNEKFQPGLFIRLIPLGFERHDGVNVGWSILVSGFLKYRARAQPGRIAFEICVLRRRLAAETTQYGFGNSYRSVVLLSHREYSGPHRVTMAGLDFHPAVIAIPRPKSVAANTGQWAMRNTFPVSPVRRLGAGSCPAPGSVHC